MSVSVQLQGMNFVMWKYLTCEVWWDKSVTVVPHPDKQLQVTVEEKSYTLRISAVNSCEL